MAGRPPRRAARFGHRLLPHRRRHPAGRRAPPRPRPRRGGVLRADRGHRAPRPRAAPRHGSGQGPGRDQCARHGLRRLPRLRGQPRSAAVARRLLPTGRPRRAWHRRGLRGPAPAAGGPRHLGVLRLPRVPSRGPGAPHPAGADRGGHGQHGRARDLGRPRPVAARADAEGPRRRRRRTTGPRWMAGDRRPTGSTTPIATRGSPRPVGASRTPCSPISTPTGAACGSCATSSTTPT